MKPHLCHIFPAFATGGPEVRTALLVNALADSFQHTIISLNGNLSGQSRIVDGNNVRFIEAPNPVRRIGHALGLFPLLQSLRPDLILTYGWGGTDGILAARWAGHRRVIHAEDGFFPEEAHKQKLQRLLARRLLLRAAARVVCPSQTLVRIAGELWYLPRNKITYLPNGVDTARFAPASPDEKLAIRKRFGFDPQDIVIGTVGHLREEKNHTRLLRAFSALSDQPSANLMRLVILGEGPLRQKLIDLATELGVADRVTFTGVINDPSDYYRAMDVFALSSDTEQMPIALLEAMSTELPVVSTDVGDVKAMVSSPNVEHVVPLGDDAAFTSALRQIVEQPALRVPLGRANRDKCLQEFDQKKMIESYAGLYQDVLSKQ